MKKVFTLVFTAVAICMSMSARKVVYNIGAFDQITVDGDVSVVYKSVSDSTGYAVYYSDTDYSSVLDISCKNGKLTIKGRPNESLDEIPVIHVYSDFLTQIKSRGESSLTAFLSMPTPTLSVTLYDSGSVTCEDINSTKVSATVLTGSGTITLDGKCKEADFKIAGTGNIYSEGLEAITVKCSCVGKGSITCMPVDKLDVKGLGTTKIYYSGDPTVKNFGTASISRLGTVEEETAPEIPDVINEDDDTPTIVTADE